MRQGSLPIHRWSSTLMVALVVLLAPAAAHADAKAGEKKAQLCLLCHKPNNAWVPTLEGQAREYLVVQLKAFKEKRRSNSAMQTNAMSLSDRDIRDIADYFSSRQPVHGAFTLDPVKVTRGKALVEKFQCDDCHGSGYIGRKEVPRLAGMEPRYTTAQFVAFATGGRAHPAVTDLSSLAADEMEDIAQYLAGLK